VNYIDAITSGYPEYQVSATGDLYSDIDWGSYTPISQSTLDTILLELIRTDKLNLVTTQRNNHMLNGMWFEGDLYDCDNIAKANVTGAVTAVLLGQTLPSNYSWRTKVNTNVPMDDVTLKAFGLAMMGYVSYVFGWSWELKNIILGITSKVQLEAFDTTALWPSNNYDGTGTGPTTADSITAMVAALQGN
jgi:hypothetical protein